MLFPDWQPPVAKPLAPIGYGNGDFEYDFKVAVPEGTEAEMRAFAEALLRAPDDAMGAAITVFGQQRGSHCYHVSITWPGREDVKRYMAEAIEEHGEAYYLPSKFDVARDIHAIAKDRYTTRDISLKAYSQYTELLDMKPKKEGGSTHQVSVGVMLVPQHGSDADWEAQMKVQQTKLLIDATAKPKEK